MRERRRGLSTPLGLADADGPGKASTARSGKLPSSSEPPVEITTPSPATAEWWFDSNLGSDANAPIVAPALSHRGRRSTCRAELQRAAAERSSRLSRRDQRRMAEDD
jgi:hypothetical protein